MSKHYTLEELLNMTQVMKRKGWSAIYIKEQGVFKVSKRYLHILMDPGMFQEIFIERAGRSYINRGIPMSKHNMFTADLRVGAMLYIDDEYYVVLSIGCAMHRGGNLQAARDFAIVAHVSIEDLVLCNLELHPAPDSIDAIMYLSKIDVHKTHLN